MSLKMTLEPRAPLMETNMMKLILLTIGLISLASFNSFAAGGGDGHHRDNTTLFPPHVPNPAMATPPPKTRLLEPTFQQTTDTSASLRWEAATGADHYHLQVATDPNFKWLVVDDHYVKGTSFNVSSLKPSTRYFWRVAGRKSDNKAATNKAPFATSAFQTR